MLQRIAGGLSCLPNCLRIIVLKNLTTSTYGHSQLKTGHPVRSAFCFCCISLLYSVQTFHSTRFCSILSVACFCFCLPKIGARHDDSQCLSFSPFRHSENFHPSQSHQQSIPCRLQKDDLIHRCLATDMDISERMGDPMVNYVWSRKYLATQ